jgi:hypothetical protein
MKAFRFSGPVYPEAQGAQNLAGGSTASPLERGARQRTSAPLNVMMRLPGLNSTCCVQASPSKRLRVPTTPTRPRTCRQLEGRDRGAAVSIIGRCIKGQGPCRPKTRRPPSEAPPLQGLVFPL